MLFCKMHTKFLMQLIDPTLSGHILDLYCVRLSNAAPFCENYTKLYFDAKHLEKGLNRGWGEIFGAFFQKSAFFGQY